ncbi:guanylate kinase [Paenibacillus baekrokdamisoli]|uniref:Guanylate kinase n=1 Tax=Paenibacillus baekrokdamisoli TaxID=1712516 RepID=A0A3G9JKI3_9BACL|nr:guanylate kinase [Paenibacillus baekrokdamisoli]MBB3068590.1 guanylate kinase [Paenibacillus baekrokdamisoli]BBH23424.1 guanylate kinase [Paenibacillus baekrokdamisoli]
MGIIFALYGPSSSGKTEIQKHITCSNLPRIITATTRAPRNKEIDGTHYIFMDNSEFQNQILNNRFIEWTEYNNELYGTLKSSIEKLVAENKCNSIILDLAGILSLKQLHQNVFAIFIGANIESIERRLQIRDNTSEELEQRILRAKEIELSEEYLQVADAIVWNNDGTDFSETLEKVKKIITNARTN